MPFYAKTLGDNYAKQVDKELRASHAGETGAVWIYRGALFAECVLKLVNFSGIERIVQFFINSVLAYRVNNIYLISLIPIVLITGPALSNIIVSLICLIFL